MASRNAKMIRRWYDEVWVRGNVGAMDEFLSPTCIVHHDCQQQSYRGAKGFRRLHRQITSTFEAFKITIHEMIEQGDRIALRWTFSALPKKVAGGSSRRRRMNLPVITIVHFKGGRFARAWDSYDATPLLSQVGAVKK